jgi:hypothetical protein
MGLAWMIAGDHQTRWHNGQTGGSHSAILINRELHFAVVVLCNTAVMKEVDQLAMQLEKKAAGQESKPEPATAAGQGAAAPTVDAKFRQRLEGRYQLAPNFIFTVHDHDGHLMVDITGQPTQEVFPDSPTRWSYHGVDASLEFKLDKFGPATSLVLHQNGIDQTANRIKDNGPVAVDAKLRQRLEGRYQLKPDFIFTVHDRDGHLMVGITNQPEQEVFPDSPTRWSYHGVDATLEFKLDKSGPATSLVLHQNGADQAAKRIKDNGPGAVAINAKLRHRLEGRYQLTPNFIFTVHDDNGHLMVEITDQPAQEVFPDSPTRWSYRGIEATLEFKLRKTGPATSLVLHQNGNYQTARRIK